MTREATSSAEALRMIEELSAEVYRGLRARTGVDAQAVELACLLLDWGHGAEAVRELVARRPSEITAPEMAELAAELLRATGFDPGFALAPERMPVLEQAVRTVAADFAGTGIVDGLHLVETYDVGPRALLALGDGTLLSTGGGLAPSSGDDPVQALIDVATELQAELAARFHLVWPLCPAHNLGLHPVRASGLAQWHCAATPAAHLVADVGHLTSSPPKG